MNNVQSLDELFHKRLFRVPDYQRGFAWEEQQIAEFLEDLEILPPNRYHYTGTVVLHAAMSSGAAMDSDGNSYKEMDIVDGQQRITTIVLLLDAIRRELENLGPTAKALAAGIKKNFISATNFNGLPLYKLTLNSDCDHYFKNNVLKDLEGIEGPQITSERRLGEAKSLLRQYLDEFEGANRETSLKQLYEKIVTRLRFSLYEVESAAEVGVIFEVMNNRGKQLSDLEKVKNFLLYASASLRVKNDLAHTVNDAWAEILRQLMAADLVSSQDENRLLRAHWLSQFDPQPRKWYGSRSIKDRFDLKDYQDDQPALLLDLHDYAEGLRSACIGFCDAYGPERHEAFKSYLGDPKARAEAIRWSARLTRIGVVAPFLPVLLAIRQRWPDDPEPYIQILRLCEPFAFRVYQLVESRADAGQALLFRVGHELFHSNISLDTACLQIKEELVRRCDDQKFREAWGDQPDNWYDWRGLRYFLYEYELDLAAKKGASPKVAWHDIRILDLQDTIEHVLPQTITGIPYWEKRFTKRLHHNYVHDLGNLSLTKHNSQYGNKSFPLKRGTPENKAPCYATSPFFMEQELALRSEWDAESIDERKNALVDWALARWAVDLENVGIITDEVVESFDAESENGDESTEEVQTEER